MRYSAIGFDLRRQSIIVTAFDLMTVVFGAWRQVSAI